MNTHTAYTGIRDPINCPANQPKPTTGEWTVYLSKDKTYCILHTGFTQFYFAPQELSLVTKVADSHNAALAAERDRAERYADDAHKALTKLGELSSQLATAVEALKFYCTHDDNGQVAQAALAKITGSGTLGDGNK